MACIVIIDERSDSLYKNFADPIIERTWGMVFRLGAHLENHLQSYYYSPNLPLPLPQIGVVEGPERYYRIKPLPGV